MCTYPFLADTGALESSTTMTAALPQLGSPEPYVLTLPTTLTEEWRPDEVESSVTAVVTLATVRGVELVAILLSHRRQTIAVVLDRADVRLADALKGWERAGRLPLRIGQGQRTASAQVPVHFDQVVHASLSSEHAQPPRGFSDAVADYSAVERVLKQLAGVRRITWGAAAASTTGFLAG